ncbi:hypothetical protein ADUPG1_007809 [Aduncisulcus paluster]|uniref:Tetratricopeptide repeat protein n=1 Tax=Aduncisulcus paluster TaxID=2918883 RepID=A0ABQ5KPM6_9EUKA|nr:hypothetical protein ADUPG1_007809 [Aduncisulcus paluster]
MGVGKTHSEERRKRESLEHRKKAERKAKQIYAQGQEYLKKEQIREAFDCFSQCVELTDAKSIYFYSRGLCHKIFKEYTEAVFDFSVAIYLCKAGDKEFANYFSIRGVCLQALGKYDEALKDLTYALRLNPKAESALFERASLYHSTNRYREALDDLVELLKLNEFHIAALSLSGKCHSALREFSAAITVLQKASEVEGSNADLLCQLGDVLFHNKEVERAETMLNRAIDIKKTDPDLFSLRGRIRAQLGEHSQALEDFSKAVQLDESPNAFVARAEALLVMKRAEEALKDTNSALEIDPDNPKYLFVHGKVLECLGKEEESESVYAKCVKLDSGHVESLYRRALLCRKHRRYIEASQILTKALRVNPDDERLYIQRGLVCGDVLDQKGAIRDLTSAIKLLDQRDTPSPIPFIHRAQSWLKLRRCVEAAADFTTAEELGGDNCDVLSGHCLAIQGLGDHGTAASLVTKAIVKQGGTDPKLFIQRSLSLRALGSHERAAGDLLTALEVDPENAKALFLLAREFMHLSKFNKATHRVRQALDIGLPLSYTADAWYVYGVCLIYRRHIVNAIEMLKNGIKSAWQLHFARKGEVVVSIPEGCPVGFEYIVHELAKAHQAIEQHEEAIVCFTEVLKHQPTNARALFRRAFSYKCLGFFGYAVDDLKKGGELEPEIAGLWPNPSEFGKLSLTELEIVPPGNEEDYPSKRTIHYLDELVESDMQPIIEASVK